MEENRENNKDQEKNIRQNLKQKKYREKRKADLAIIDHQIDNEIFTKKTCLTESNDFNYESPSTSEEKNLIISNEVQSNLTYSTKNSYIEESSESDESFVEDYKFSNKTDLIYPYSMVTKEDFVILLESTMDKIGVAETNRDKLYKFIKLILPRESNIPDSYNIIRQSFRKNQKIITTFICSFCKNEIKKVNSKTTCHNDTCTFNRQIKKKSIIKIFNSCVKDQIKLILDNHYDTILNYQNEKIKQKNQIFSDIITGNIYKFEPGVLNLILFADAVSYNKSGNNSIWTLMSSVAELPPLLRGSFENIIIHSSWSGSSLDFNLWLKKYNSEIDDIILNGIQWCEKKINIKILGFISDSPARSKACNSNQFNGYYGCIKCLHPGQRINNVMVYPVLPNIFNRTHETYCKQVERANSTKICIEGVKGFSYLSNWIKIPDNVIIDYMHLSLIGTFKKMFNSFFDRNNWHHNFYLGKVINFIDNRLMNVKLPTEIKRKTRPIEDRHFYKANEFRTILFYLSFGIFKGILKDIYLMNLLKFVIFMRLLCQDEITKEELNDAQKIIIDFITEFESLYGQINMTSNLHTHIHLPEQVKNFGPLNKTSCFPFENVFKMTRDLFYGTRNYEGQIIMNFDRRKNIRAKIKAFSDEAKNVEIQSYLKNEISNIKSCFTKNQLINPHQVDYFQLVALEKQLIDEFCQKNHIIKNNITILKSKRALFNKLEYHSVDYDRRFESLNNNLIQYENEKSLLYGCIIRFFSINESCFVLVKKFKQNKKDCFYNNFSIECSKYIDKFFQIGEFVEIFELIKLERISRRCISVSTDNGLVISPTNDLTEFD